MLLSNFHTHTFLCKHATGTPAEYVASAAEYRHSKSSHAEISFGDGCAAFGISDHCPFPDETWSGSRMSVADLPRYLALVAEAKAVAPFPLFWGFECEWYPAYANWLRELRESTGAEYFVYGAHWVNDNGDFYYIPEISERHLLARYVALTVQGIESGLFDMFAHPDLFLGGFHSFDADVRAASAEIIGAAIAAGLPMEINGLGLRKTRVPGDNGMRAPYPVREFWEMAAASGARIICNSDAHRRQDALLGAQAAYEFAASIGITPEILLDPRLPARAPKP